MTARISRSTVCVAPMTVRHLSMTLVATPWPFAAATPMRLRSGRRSTIETPSLIPTSAVKAISTGNRQRNRCIRSSNNRR